MRVAADMTRYVLSAVLALMLSAPVHAQQDAGEEKVLRVCEDPNNLPFSHRNGEGFENKIAELLARDLGWKLEYTWFPQRIGFIRNTLRAYDRDSGRYKCDLVIGLPVGFELASMTKPYYTSTYALVYPVGRKLGDARLSSPDELLRLDPQVLRSLKIGVVAQTPGVDWLLKHGLYDQAVAYQRQTGDPEQYPGQIVEIDLAEGKIDAAIVWGPIAGYFARRVRSPELVVVPFPTAPDIKFDYSIGMGVRFGEREWKAQVEQLIERNRAGIRKILAEYGVPLLDDRGRPMRSEDESGAPSRRAGERRQGAS